MSQLTLQELQLLIIEWANNKELVKKENAPKQRLKLLEEVGETAKAILQNNQIEVKDGVGDIFVVLIILFAQLEIEVDFNISDMLEETELEYYILFQHLTGLNVSFFSLGYLNDISKKSGLDLTECANIAWNEIKNRTGETINGTFIKD